MKEEIKINFALPSFKPIGDGIKFECTRCGECCHLPVMLSGKESNQVEKMGISVKKVNGSDAGVMEKNSKGMCPLYASGSCSIYSRRPSPCRSYPFYEFAGQLYVDVNCPGVGKGKYHSERSIRSLVVDRLRDIKGIHVKKILREFFGEIIDFSKLPILVRTVLVEKGIAGKEILSPKGKL